MDLKDLQKRAIEIGKLYDAYNEKRNGKGWSNVELMGGLVGDVGDLMKIVMTKEGLRTIEGDVDEKLKHELADCLWCVLVLAEKYGVDLGEVFKETMEGLEKRIKSS